MGNRRKYSDRESEKPQIRRKTLAGEENDQEIPSENAKYQGSSA